METPLEGSASQMAVKISGVVGPHSLAFLRKIVGIASRLKDKPCKMEWILQHVYLCVADVRIFQRFHNLRPNVIPEEMSEEIASTLKIPTSFLEEMPEFKENPFNKRIFRVFSADGSSELTFNEFLDMFSVFSDSAPREQKISYAFKIYDFDEDKELGRSDLNKTLRCLTRNELTEDEIHFVVDKVLEEGDFDQKGSLSYMEFEHIISRDPDFLSMFHIRI